MLHFGGNAIYGIKDSTNPFCIVSADSRYGIPAIGNSDGVQDH